jgi:hypothetical protein
MPGTVRGRWLDSYVEQTLTRDIETLDGRRDPTRLRAYLEALALNTAGVVTDKTLYDAASVNARTGEAYERLLRDLLLLDKIPAWFSNRLKRLIRGSKRYVVDPALVAALPLILRECPALQGGGESHPVIPAGRQSGRFCCEMYSFTTDSGAPPHDPAKYEGDQKWPCMIARLTRPVNSARRRREETPLRLFTKLASATFGG